MLVLARLRVPPAVVVVSAGAAGIAAAVELGRGSLLVAAGLVQLKTLLDNADGQLARLTGRTSSFGRYLDSELDLVVNAALFAALGWRYGSPALALAGFVALTSVLSLNFNAARLSTIQPTEADDDGGRGTAILRHIYDVVYAPQDRLAEWVVARRPSLIAPSRVTVLDNLGMSSQLAVFGVFLVVGHPLGFAWLAVAELGVIALAAFPQRAPVEEPA